MLYGYARVSTVEQETALQLDALTRAGAERIYSEKVSAVGRRPQLVALLEQVRKGDVLLVYKLDRLARSLKDLLAIIERLERAGCGLRSVTEPIATDTLAGRMMLQMLGAVAEFERGLIRERTRAGLQAARARGVRLGRPRRLPVEAEDEIVSMIDARAMTYRECARLFGVEEHVITNAVYRGRRRLAGIDFRKRNESGTETF